MTDFKWTSDYLVSLSCTVKLLPPDVISWI